MRRALEARHKRVLEASDGNTAIAKACEGKPQLALVDLWMPDQNGVWTIANLRSLDVAMVIVLLSGDLENRYVADAMKAGAEHCLDKFTPADAILRYVEQGEPIDTAPSGSTIAEASNYCVRSALIRAKGNVTDAARMLGITRCGLQKMMKKSVGRV